MLSASFSSSFYLCWLGHGHSALNPQAACHCAPGGSFAAGGHLVTDLHLQANNLRLHAHGLGALQRRTAVSVPAVASIAPGRHQCGKKASKTQPHCHGHVERIPLRKIS